MISDTDLIQLQKELKYIFHEYYIIHINNFITIQTGDVNQDHLELIRNRLSAYSITIEPNDKSSLTVVFFKNVEV
jgi:hypothetical protein